MFRQRAHGTFTVPVIPGTPHCGINNNAVTCNYRIDLAFDNDALDTDGFLLDNTAFKGYFESLCTRPVDVSCENLCKQICNDLCELCDNRARFVRVALSPFAGVEVEFNYRPEHVQHTKAIAA